jgi:hypothetical protein
MNQLVTLQHELMQRYIAARTLVVCSAVRYPPSRRPCRRRSIGSPKSCLLVQSLIPSLNILTPVKGGDEHNLVALLDLVIEFSLELPVGVIYQNQDPWTSVNSGVSDQFIYREPPIVYSHAIAVAKHLHSLR